MSEAATIEHLRSALGNRPATALSHSRARMKNGSLGGYSGGAGLIAKHWPPRLEGASL